MPKECSIMQQLGEELCATKRAYVARKRIRDASIYTSKKISLKFYS